jgi:hypothetical protein
MGASINAFNIYLKKKGYRLVGCISLGFNAFFIKNGLGDREFPEVDTNVCFRHWERKEWKSVMERRIIESKNYEWVTIE